MSWHTDDWTTFFTKYWKAIVVVAIVVGIFLLGRHFHS